MARFYASFALASVGWLTLIACGSQQQRPTSDRAAAPAPITCEGGDYLNMLAGDLQFTWNKQVNCLGAPERGSFRAEIEYLNPVESGEAIALAALKLHKITPKPAMGAHVDSVGALADTVHVETPLPIELAPGERATVALTGRFLLDTDEDGSMRANFHLKMHGAGVTSGKALAAGTTLHVLSATEREPDGGGRENAAGWREEQRRLGTPPGDEPPPDPD